MKVIEYFFFIETDHPILVFNNNSNSNNTNTTY